MESLSRVALLEEPSEVSPLLENGQTVIAQGTGTDSKHFHQLKKIFRSRGFLAFSCSSAFLFIIWCLVYLGIIPPMIHDAVNGHGSIFNHLHLHDMNPIVANISILIPFTDPKPASAKVEFGKMQLAALDPESTITPETLLGFFTLDPLNVPSEESQAWINSSLTICEPNYSWVSWFLKTGIKHGFNKQQFALYIFQLILE
jgi:hypothetical protein